MKTKDLAWRRETVKMKSYLVEQRHQLSSLHREIILVLGMVAVQNNELAEGVFEERMNLW